MDAIVSQVLYPGGHPSTLLPAGKQPRVKIDAERPKSQEIKVLLGLGQQAEFGGSNALRRTAQQHRGNRVGHAQAWVDDGDILPCHVVVLLDIVTDARTWHRNAQVGLARLFDAGQKTEVPAVGGKTGLEIVRVRGKPRDLDDHLPTGWDRGNGEGDIVIDRRRYN